MKRFGIFILLLLSFAAAFVGTSLSSYRVVKPANGWEVFEGISPADGWIEDGAKISLPGLATRGNRLELNFKGWRPGGVAAAHMQALVCGKLASEFHVSGVTQQTIYLTGNCEPREVEFKVLNPFQASAKDQRALGTQLEQVKVVSSAKMPIIRPEIVVVAGLLLFIGALLSGLAIPEFFAFASVATTLLGGVLVSQARYLALDICFALWLFTSALMLGVILYRRWVSGAEPSPTKGSFPAIIGLFAVALGAGLRLYGLDFGLPVNFHPDEVPKVNAVMRMYSQDTFNPQYFLHPTLLLYSTYFVNSVIHFFGTASSFQESAFFAGRIVSYSAGVLSIFLTFRIGARLFSPWTGALSALLLAVYPLHITSSRYLKEDSLLTFFILLCVLLTVAASQDKKKWMLLLAGLVAGLAASTKYSGVLCFCIVAAAPWLRSKSFIPDKSWFGVTVLACALLPIGFFLGTPYSILDSQKFLRDFNHERSHMTRGHTLAITAWSQYWMYHFQRSLIPGMSLIGTMLATAGLGVLLVRRRLEDWYLVCLVLLFYLPAEFVKAKPAPQPERYIFPCLPFLAIAASEFLQIIRRSSLWQKGSLAIALFLLACLTPLYRSTQLASEIYSDTRTQMGEWMKQNIPHGAKVAIDWRPYEPAFPDGEFTLEYLPRANIASHLRLERLAEADYDYLLLSSLWYDRYFSQPRSDVTVRRRIEEVFSKVPIVKEFRPEHGTYGFHNPSVTLFALKKPVASARVVSLQ